MQSCNAQTIISNLRLAHDSWYNAYSQRLAVYHPTVFDPASLRMSAFPVSLPPDIVSSEWDHRVHQCKAPVPRTSTPFLDRPHSNRDILAKRADRLTRPELYYTPHTPSHVRTPYRRPFASASIAADDSSFAHPLAFYDNADQRIHGQY